MRVISGLAKGRKLKSPKTWDVRPTSDRVKESLFNIVLSCLELEDKVFLDLYAGTGNVGIEALSRGVKEAVFVEKETKIIEIISDNLANIGFSQQAKIIKADAVHAISMLNKMGRTFDFIFLDPPYNLGFVDKTLLALDYLALLNLGGVIIVEHQRSEKPTEDLRTLKLFDRRKYGQTELSFYCLS